MGGRKNKRYKKKDRKDKNKGGKENKKV